MALPLIPIIIAAGAYADYEKDFSGLHLKDRLAGKKTPPGQPAHKTGGASETVVIPTAPAHSPAGPTPPLTPPFSNPSTGQPIAPTTNEANQIANVVQPQPKDQPPLPPAPPPASLPQGSEAIVATNGTAGTNNAALRVRSQPSTTAAPVPGGEPSNGGGFDKGQTIQITGPMTAGFVPVTGKSRLGPTISGWGWAGYIQGTKLAESVAVSAGEAPTMAGEMDIG